MLANNSPLVVNWNYSHKIVSREGLSLESIKRMLADVR